MSDIRPGVDFPPSVDLEFSEAAAGKPMLEKIGVEKALQRFGKYWKAVKDAFGVYPMIYTSGRVWRENLGDAKLPIPEMIHSPIWCKGGGGYKSGGGYRRHGKEIQTGMDA